MHEKTVRVELGERSYEVLIAAGHLGRLASLLAPRVRCARVILISDSNVACLHGQACLQQLRQLAPTDLLEIPPGEQSKSIDRASELWESLLARASSRDTLIVGLGGGVVGDLAGFVAATYARGLPLVHAPTSLLAQVDSSIGGKVGINLSTAKNMVGAFWQPRTVIIDTDLLATLSEREYRAGLAEVVKYGVIADRFFELLEHRSDAIAARDPQLLTEIVARCCELKAEVVAADETEQSGRREILNYGHTIGHAIEAVSGYGRYLHGEAVAVGMMAAAHLAVGLRMLAESELERQRALLANLGLPCGLPNLPAERILELIRTDKKSRQGRVRFVLPTQIGHVQIVEQPVEDCAVLEAIGKVSYAE